MIDAAGTNAPLPQTGLQDLLTVVIPTYDRRRLLMRALRYWAGLPVRVIVMDGSPDALAPSDLPSIHNRIAYVHAPISIIKRMAQAGDMVETPFVTLIGDDEFHLYSGLAGSVAELQQDPGLVACMGRAVGFNLLEDGRLGGRQVYADFAGRQIFGDTPAARMVQHFARYAPSTIYSVQRVTAWRQAYAAPLEREFPILASAEIQVELAMAALGRSKILPILHWFRSYESAPVRDTPDTSLSTRTRMHSWWSDPDQQEGHTAFSTLTARHIAQATGSPRQKIDEGVRQALDAYVRFVADGPARLRADQLRIRELESSARPLRNTVQALSGFDRMLPFLTALQLLSETGVTWNPSEVHKIACAILDTSGANVD